MFKSTFSPLLMLVGLLSLIACIHTDDPLWNEVADYFTNPARTKQEMYSRLSPNALQAIVGQPTTDTTELIIELFRDFKENHNYNVDKKVDTVYVSFNPADEIAGGPFFEIVKGDTTWKVVEIRFGK